MKSSEISRRFNLNANHPDNVVGADNDRSGTGSTFETVSAGQRQAQALLECFHRALCRSKASGAVDVKKGELPPISRRRAGGRSPWDGRHGVGQYLARLMRRETVARLRGGRAGTRRAPAATAIPRGHRRCASAQRGGLVNTYDRRRRARKPTGRSSCGCWRRWAPGTGPCAGTSSRPGASPARAGASTPTGRGGSCTCPAARPGTGPPCAPSWPPSHHHPGRRRRGRGPAARPAGAGAGGGDPGGAGHQEAGGGLQLVAGAAGAVFLRVTAAG